MLAAQGGSTRVPVVVASLLRLNEVTVGYACNVTVSRS
jgi:hypothetical protein